MSTHSDPESVVREIKRKTRRKYSPEEKIRIVLEGLRSASNTPIPIQVPLDPFKDLLDISESLGDIFPCYFGISEQYSGHILRFFTIVAGTL